MADQYFPTDYCWEEGFGQMNMVQKVGYYYLAMQGKKFFYFNPFSFTTGGIVASGLGYNGSDKWDKVISVYIWELETSTSPIDMLRYWNHMVHLWLKFYVFGRLVTPGKKPGVFENMATFIVSAFWHGFYPFYYVMFFVAAMLSELAKDVYKCWIFFEFIPPTLKPILANMLSMIAMNYCGIL